MKNPITSLDGLQLPTTVNDFECQGCSITVVRGFKWPSRMSIVALGESPLKSFELRASDFEAENRPTAMEVYFELRELMKSYQRSMR